MKRDQMMVNK